MEYRFFSEDLSSAIVQPFGLFIACNSSEGATQPCLSLEASEQTAFLHNNTTGAYTPLVTGKPPFANVPENTAFGDQGPYEGCEIGEPLICGPKFVAATPDDSHVILESGALTKEGGGLYEWSADEPPSEQLASVGLLPEKEGGGPPTGGAHLGAEHEGARGAVSSDGSRVFWSTDSALYMRDVPAKKTLRLDLPQAACAAEGTCGRGTAFAAFQLASSDGSRVLFTDRQRLTADSGAQGAGLYECAISESAGEPKCELFDLTPKSTTGESASVQGDVLGESEDGSYLYFVADGVLEHDGAPVSGAVHGTCEKGGTELCNLYVRHDGETKLVAVLSGEDHSDWGGFGLKALIARVSPNGRYLVFMSDRELTGYDNHDAVSGKSDEEVYEYDAATGRTSCASCDPSGARPVGDEIGAVPRLVHEIFAWPETSWLAATVPGWQSSSGGDTVYQSRYLSNTGRLFFNARSSLVPNDVNDQWDVYEYEPEGVGTCTSATGSGSDVFKPANTIEVEGRDVEEGPGCVGLISSGESKDESVFLDASEASGEGPHGEELNDGGGDVFFLTTAKLAPQDVDESYDVYDAHECTSESPCTQAATTPAPCNNEASCKPAPEPQPSVYGPPASATFSGPGNLASPPLVVVKKATKKTAKCRHGFVRKKVKKKAQCVKVKSKKKAKKSSHGKGGK
jgi:hypothetical protein